MPMPPVLDLKAVDLEICANCGIARHLHSVEHLNCGIPIVCDGFIPPMPDDEEGESE